MDLAQALAADVRGTFPVLVSRYGDAVYSATLRLCGPCAAEDLAQDTFVRAFRALDGYSPTRIAQLKLRAWLLTIALNVARNHLQATRRHPTTHPSGEGPADSAPLAQELVERVELRAQLAAALLRIPPAQREAVVLRHVVGCPLAEVAAVLDRPLGTVKAQVSRGLRQLRAELQVPGRAEEDATWKV